MLRISLEVRSGSGKGFRYESVRGITKLSDLMEILPDIYLWKGDIKTLACDAVVNAAI